MTTARSVTPDRRARSGDTGSQGEVGETGSQGEVGDTGSQGEAGETGSQGEAGRDGVSGAVWSGTLNTLQTVGNFGNGGTNVAGAAVNLTAGASGLTLTGTAGFKPTATSQAGTLACAFTVDGIDIQTHGQAEVYVPAGLPTNASLQISVVGALDEESFRPRPAHREAELLHEPPT